MIVTDSIDPRLNEIDDCLYRVSNKMIVTKDDKVLMVWETPEMWWSFPGGGVDHGETVESAILRELDEELGVRPEDVATDFKIIYHTIGTVVNNIPRMNLFYRASIAPEAIGKTRAIGKYRWYTREEFMTVHMSASFKNRGAFADLIFGPAA